MADRAGADIGDDFHVAVRMRGKAGLRRDGVVVPDPQRAPAHAIGVVIAREGEMVAGVEPAVVGMAQAVEFADVDHGLVLSSRGAEHRAAASRCSNSSDGDDWNGDVWGTSVSGRE